MLLIARIGQQTVSVLFRLIQLKKYWTYTEILVGYGKISSIKTACNLEFGFILIELKRSSKPHNHIIQLRAIPRPQRYSNI